MPSVFVIISYFYGLNFFNLGKIKTRFSLLRDINLSVLFTSIKYNGNNSENFQNSLKEENYNGRECCR
jgi:hypothetical protein